jgi:hypothetical protein
VSTARKPRQRGGQAFHRIFLFLLRARIYREIDDRLVKMHVYVSFCKMIFVLEQIHVRSFQPTLVASVPQKCISQKDLLYMWQR